MPTPERSAAQRVSIQRRSDGEVTTRGYWLVPVLRAAPAIVVGLIITFSEDHGPRVGLSTFGLFALVSGAILLVGSLRAITDRVVRGVLITQAAISLVAGAAAVALMDSGIGVLLLIVTVYAALTGVLELYASLRSRGAAPARDWLMVGAYTAVAAIVFVLIPPDSILTIGLIGSYAVVLGVFLVIAGLSLKWAAAAPGPGEAAESHADADEGKVSS